MGLTAGHGMTLVFAAPMAHAGRLTILGPREATRGEVETTAHDSTKTTGRTWQAQALADHGGCDFEYHFDTEIGDPPIDADTATATVTYPKTAAAGAAASLAGDSFFTNIGQSAVEFNATETIRTTGSFRWTEKPTFTAETIV